MSQLLNHTILSDKKVKTLKDDMVVLISAAIKNNLEYYVSLVKQYRYCTLNENKIILGFGQFGWKFWDAFYQGEQFGFIFLSYLPSLGMRMDAYKDKNGHAPLEASYRGGKLSADYVRHDLAVPLWTGHDQRNRLATSVCKRIGFEVEKILQNGDRKFVWLRRR